MLLRPMAACRFAMKARKRYSRGEIPVTKRTYAAILALLLLGLPAVAQLTLPQFSADLQMTGRGGQEMTGKMYFGGQHMRMDMDMRGHQSIMITDVAKKTSYMLMPQQKMYMEFNAQMAGRRGPDTQDMKPMDINNPCANQEGVTCKKVGTETVNGRSCDKWVFTGKNGETRTAWIDQKLHFPVKMESESTTWEMKNIKEGAQPASLFEIPSDYQKMDMGGMMGGRRPTPN
jgi:hypothetical protein